ncbi:alpha/beta fold hydrolase [Roseomonas harenae]|uniref:alpha/beta fold hydrolase n=1 Tax=Muricoccus harenae TaxID=2692566 RepID=UPI0013311ACE|nr:alpha/beta hydrolase [Roseomonas harenae]
MADHSEETVSVKGCRIRLMRGGEGPPLLFLHGAGGAGPWAPFMGSLAKRFDVIVPEHPGFGTADTPDWLDNVHDLAYFYLDFLAAQGLRGVHLVGLSLGGWIAAEMAIRDTSRLASLTLVNAAGIHVPGVPQVDGFLSTDEQRIRDLFHDQSFAEAAIARSLRPEMEDVMLKDRQTAAKLMWHPRSYDPHLAKWLGRIDVPTLLLWGAQDKVVPEPYGHAFQRLIPGSQLSIISECGHLPNIERADEFVAEITRFIGNEEGAR